MITRDEALNLSTRRGEDSGFGIVRSISKELQSKKWMGRAAFTQIDLDSIRSPFPRLRTNHNKIDRKPSEHSFGCQALADLHCFFRNQTRVISVCRKLTPQVTLTTWTAKQLIVRGQQLHLP